MLSQIKNLLNKNLLRRFDLELVRHSALPAEYKVSDHNERFKRRIVFFHPPKCGGTAVDTWLSRQFGDSDQLANSASRQAAEALDLTMPQVREVLLAYELRRSKHRFISGHYLFSERALRGKYDELDMITILREPKSRLLSHYYFNRYKTDREHFGIDLDLEQWLNTSSALRAASMFARIFAGDIDSAQANADDERLSSARAINNLERFTIVGILEKRRDFETKIKERYNLKGELKHLRVNPSKNYPKFNDQPTHIKERIEELCAVDSDIYREFI